MSSGARKRLTEEEIDELRQLILDDNERIEHERTFGSIDASRPASLRLVNLASRFGVTANQVKYVVRDIY